MRALRKLTPGAGYPELTDIPVPTASIGQVRLAVSAAGVCGTDLHIIHGDYPSNPPVTLGHEVAGHIDQVGPDGDESMIGSLVAPQTVFSSCRVCLSCARGKPMLCEHRLSIGSGVDGGFASRLVVPANRVHRLPHGLDATLAALSEPLACVCNALLDPPVIGPSDNVLVTGVGTIGLLAAQVARACGATVTVAGKAHDRERLAVASGLGFTTRSVDDPADVETLEDLGRDRHFDAVVECAGHPAAADFALRVIRPGGTYVQMGLLPGRVAIPFGRIVDAEITVRSGFASSPRSWLRAMRLLEDDTIDLQAIVTEVVPIDDWRKAFDNAEKGIGLKNLITPA